MNNYSSVFCFKLNFSEGDELLKLAISNLDYQPTIMYLYFDEDHKAEDVPFDQKILSNALQKGASKIQVMNKAYNENEEYKWFRLVVDNSYKVFRLEWYNSDLNFLINSDLIKRFIRSDNFICGYCYDANDCYIQSNQDIDFFTLNAPGQSYSITKNEFGEIVINKEKQWGRIEKAGGLTFMAAPLMWFGVNFYDIISKSELSKYKYSINIQQPNIDCVHIYLFDLYTSPSFSSNRIKQKDFWEYFNLKYVIENYERRINLKMGIDSDGWINQYLKKTKRKL